MTEIKDEVKILNPRREYMREYMRRYNEKKRKPKNPELTPQQKLENSRKANRKYYEQRKDIINAQRRKRRKEKRITRIREELKEYEKTNT